MSRKSNISAFTTLLARNAQLEMALQTRGPEHIDQVLRALRDAGLAVEIDTY